MVQSADPMTSVASPLSRLACSHELVNLAGVKSHDSPRRSAAPSTLIGVTLLSALVCTGSNTATAQDSSNPDRAVLKVMSFNIRYGAANDGENSWPHRKHLVSETIRTFDPDLLGLQEVLEFQADFLREELPGYGFHGVGREDGKRKGEFVPLMYRKDRFYLVDAGHFWLSEEPEVPGSKSWDSSLPRMLSWVALEDRENGYRQFVFANVHFDHRGKEARLQSARLIRERAAEVPDGMPIVLTGDFNATEDQPPYAALTGDVGAGTPFLDTFRVIHPERSPFEATSTGWQPKQQGRRIDWILIKPPFQALNATINRTIDGNRLPSDHYPVEAVIRFADE